MGLFLSREILDITGMSIHKTRIRGEGVRFEISVPAGRFRFGSGAQQPRPGTGSTDD